MILSIQIMRRWRGMGSGISGKFVLDEFRRFGIRWRVMKFLV